MVEAQEALQAAANFLNSTSYEYGGCAVQCRKPPLDSAAANTERNRARTPQADSGTSGLTTTGGAAVVHWHYRYNYKPPATQADCRDIW